MEFHHGVHPGHVAHNQRDYGSGTLPPSRVLAKVVGRFNPKRVLSRTPETSGQLQLFYGLPRIRKQYFMQSMTLILNFCTGLGCTDLPKDVPFPGTEWELEGEQLQQPSTS